MAEILNSKGELALGGLVDLISAYQEESSVSLFSYTQRAIINSRVFIEDSVATDEIATPLMQNIMTLYTGLVLTALNLNQNVDGGRKVADNMSVVSTESWQEQLPEEQPVAMDSVLKDFFLKGNNGSKAQSKLFSPLMQNNNANNSNGPIFDRGGPLDPYITRSNANKDFNKGAKEDPSVGKTTGVVETEPKNVSLPTGRTIQCQMHTDSGHPVAVNMMLQLSPTIITPETASQFVLLNFTPSTAQRYLQAKIGEINFFNDFLFGCDLRAKRMKALMNDKTHVLHDMLRRQQNAVHNNWLKKSLIHKDRHNIANTILIFNKQTFDRACSQTGLKFNNYSNRQRFFDKTFAMMLVVVDPMFNDLTMYFNGLNAVSTFKYEQMKREAKKESTDLVSIMKTYAQGLAPKF